MSLLLVTAVHKHYGAQEVLRGATFQIDPGEKIGLVGRNGGGKSTLLRLVEGLEQPDGGHVLLRKGARLGHVPQIPRLEPGVSVRAYVESGMREANELAREVEALAERMGASHGVELDRLIREHETLSHRVGALGGWDMERRVETVLSGIGLAPEFWDREARTLSGGEKSRVALARELVAGHDLLLLDEPTNHLDLAGIEWIESWLREQKGAVLIVSHDRRLLDRAVDAILELERGTLRRYPGSYSKYVALRNERFTSEQRAWEIQSDFVQREEAFIRKHMGSQRTAEAKGRQKKLENLVRLERPQDDLRKPRIPPPKIERGGELVLEATALAGGYPGVPIFSGLDLRIGRGQRIGIVGPNGAGKTTLLRVLGGRLAPTGGQLVRGHREVCGFYDQDTSSLDESSTPFGEMRRDHPDLTDLELRSHLARFLFRGDEIEKSVASLSGGERARLCLARLMLRGVSWLAMDEPTNHLDLAARTALEETLGAFDGALVCISHDREFLDGLCTHLLVVEEKRVRAFTGNYSDWRRTRAEEDLRAAEERDEAKAEEKKRSRAKATPAPARSASAGKVRNPFQFERLEKRIIALEEQLARLHEEMATEAVYRDPARLKESQVRGAEIERELAEANAEWENWG